MGKALATVQQEVDDTLATIFWAPDTERAWAAGVWDGEGHCGLAKGNTSTPRFIRLSTSQKYYPEVIDRFDLATSELGTLTQRTRPDNTIQGVCYQWRVQSRAKVIVVMEHLLWPYLSLPKKRQYLLAITTAEAFANGETARIETFYEDYEGMAKARGLVLQGPWG